MRNSTRNSKNEVSLHFFSNSNSSNFFISGQTKLNVTIEHHNKLDWNPFDRFCIIIFQIRHEKKINFLKIMPSWKEKFQIIAINRVYNRTLSLSNASCKIRIRLLREPW